MERAAHHAGGMMLDIGCGSKPYEKLFLERARAYIGVDVDTDKTKKVDVCADALRLPFRSETFDTVISNQAIEHVRHPEQFVSEACRVLRTGGIMIMTAPQLWCLHEKPHDYYRFTRYALELLCKENNLDVVTLQERYGAFATIGQMIALMVYLPNAGRRWRTHAARLIFGPAQVLGKFFDRLFYNPDLTLGYLLVARTRESTNNS
jgi:SAM-dependent methyltransferase